MRSRLVTLAPIIFLSAAACSAGSSRAPSLPAAPPPIAASPTVSATNFVVKLTDALRMEPAAMAVKAGQVVTFVVTNSGAIPHEFYLGNQDAQDAHEQAMTAGGMSLHEADGIVLKPGETRELVHTFATAGAFLAGCHEPGHYAGGMKAAITASP